MKNAGTDCGQDDDYDDGYCDDNVDFCKSKIHTATASTWGSKCNDAAFIGVSFTPMSVRLFR